MKINSLNVQAHRLSPGLDINLRNPSSFLDTTAKPTANFAGYKVSKAKVMAGEHVAVKLHRESWLYRYSGGYFGSMKNSELDIFGGGVERSLAVGQKDLIRTKLLEACKAQQLSLTSREFRTVLAAVEDVVLKTFGDGPFTDHSNAAILKDDRRRKEFARDVLSNVLAMHYSLEDESDINMRLQAAVRHGTILNNIYLGTAEEHTIENWLDASLRHLHLVFRTEDLELRRELNEGVLTKEVARRLPDLGDLNCADLVEEATKSISPILAADSVQYMNSVGQEIDRRIEERIANKDKTLPSDSRATPGGPAGLQKQRRRESPVTAARTGATTQVKRPQSKTIIDPPPKEEASQRKPLERIGVFANFAERFVSMIKAILDTIAEFWRKTSKVEPARSSSAIDVLSPPLDEPGRQGTEIEHPPKKDQTTDRQDGEAEVPALNSNDADETASANHWQQLFSSTSARHRDLTVDELCKHPNQRLVRSATI